MSQSLNNSSAFKFLSSFQVLNLSLDFNPISFIVLTVHDQIVMLLGCREFLDAVSSNFLSVGLKDYLTSLQHPETRDELQGGHFTVLRLTSYPSKMALEKLRLLFDEHSVPEVPDKVVSKEIEPLFRAIFSEGI